MSWTQTLFLLNKTLCTISYIIKQLEYKGGGSINQTVEPVDLQTVSSINIRRGGVNKSNCRTSRSTDCISYKYIKGWGSINQTVEPVDQIFIGKLGRTTGIFLDWF